MNDKFLVLHDSSTVQYSNLSKEDLLTILQNNSVSEPILREVFAHPNFDFELLLLAVGSLSQGKDWILKNVSWHRQIYSDEMLSYVADTVNMGVWHGLAARLMDENFPNSQKDILWSKANVVVRKQIFLDPIGIVGVFPEYMKVEAFVQFGYETTDYFIEGFFGSNNALDTALKSYIVNVLEYPEDVNNVPRNWAVDFIRACL